MKSYFFVPASKLSNYDSIKELGVDEIILDFEDAVLASKRESYFQLIEKKSIQFMDAWFRIPLHDEDSKLNLSFLSSFIKVGFRKFLLPKLQTKAELETVVEYLKGESNNSVDIKLILLVETPRLFIQLRSIMESEYSGLIYGLGVGSHDLLKDIGAIHTFVETFFPRMEILYVAKAFDKQSIDIASMNISTQEEFNFELESGISSGFDAKFLIHPIQLSWKKANRTLQEQATVWARKIITSLPENYLGGSVEPFVLDGKVVEKPHVDIAMEILRKYNDEK